MPAFILSWIFHGITAVNLVQNPDFASGLAAWELSGSAVFDHEVFQGRPAGVLRVPPEHPVGYPALCQRFELPPHTVIDVRVLACGQGIADGFGAYLAVEFLDADGKRLAVSQSSNATDPEVWTPLRLRSVVPPGAAATVLRLILNGRGKALFADARFTVRDDLFMEAPQGSVSLKVTDEIVCDRLLGFGAQDDAWIYNAENAARGVTEADLTLRERRIEEMQIDIVRMFCWYKDWNPSGDWQTWTWDSDNMKALYRALDFHQRLGTSVILTGVEWGMPSPFANPAGMAEAIGVLLERLVRDKGYTCIRYWTLTNEPNLHSRVLLPFDVYVEIHERVKRQIKDRGLPIAIVGSDDTNGGEAWFAACLESDTYLGLVDLFASHRYLQAQEAVTAPLFFEEYLGLLAGRRPFMVAEFGFLDARSSALNNPIMESYEYALWVSRFVHQGLNAGAAAFLIWCMHEMVYPNDWFMNFGLWNHKNREWTVRPVYYAWRLFGRHTAPGQKVRRVISSHPMHVSAAMVGATLFWTNQLSRPVEIILDGDQVETSIAFTRDALENGTIMPINAGKMILPPESFGYAF